MNRRMIMFVKLVSQIYVRFYVLIGINNEQDE